jgi:YidC/Oxa1 family membrane protein insertase
MPENQEAPSPARIIPAGESTDIPQRYLPTVVLDIGLKTLLPGSKIERNYKVYAGSKSKENLVGNDYDFSELLFPELWHWMRTLSFALLWMLEFIYKLIPSWGFAIICLAVCVRLLMYPLAQRSLKSQQAFMAVQKAMGPELAEIKKNYKGGEQSERILQLYEQHNISPMAGLKPLLLVLIQIPIFVALFNVLGQVFEFRDASFLWIDTLAEPDKLFSLGFEIPLLGAYFNLLPVLMAVSTLLMIGMSSPPSADGETRKRKPWGLLLMTFGFFILFYPFPSGMVLYWTMANVLHLVQQWVVGLSVKDLS